MAAPKKSVAELYHYLVIIAAQAVIEIKVRDVAANKHQVALRVA
jgi:hypothetical protein